MADAKVRRGLAVASFEAFEMGAKAVVRRGLAIAALVAFNVAAAASVMRRRLALSGASQAARAGVGVPRDALVRARLQALARAVVLARKLRDRPFDVVGR